MAVVYLLMSNRSAVDMEQRYCCVVCSMKQHLELQEEHLLIWHIKNAGLLLWSAKGGVGVTFVFQPLTNFIQSSFSSYSNIQYSCVNHLYTETQGEAGGDGYTVLKTTGHTTMGMGEDYRKARELQTGTEWWWVNITVEAHWCLLTGGEQCDSTNVAAGISEQHPAFTAFSLVSAACRNLTFTIM